MDNRSFWNHRYVTLPRLGSGPGSRGYAASYKNVLVHALIREKGIRTIMDIGCGDLCWLDDRITQACTYTGSDISEVVIERNAVAHPSLRFVVHDIAAAPIGFTADLVISFDVLIHQTERATFSNALTNILAAVGKVALVSYLTPPLPDGRFAPEAKLDPSAVDAAAIADEERFQKMLSEELPHDRPAAETAFHGPLPELVRELHATLETRAVGAYRRQTVYAIMPHC